MGQYTVTHQLAAVASKPELYVVSDGNVLPEITYFEVACISAPADFNFDFSLKEITAVGTGGTSLTPQKNGPAAASSCTAKGGTYSSDPTSTGGPMAKPTLYLRQRWCLQKAVGEGFKPTLIASNRGLSIWCDSVGTAGILCNHTLNYVE